MQIKKLVLPRFDCPIPPSLNPHATAAQQHSLEWANTLNLLPNPRAIKRTTAGKFGILAGRFYPFASPDSLNIGVDWITWLFVLDDIYCDEGEMGMKPAQLRNLLNGLLLILQQPDAEYRGPDEPLHQALHDLWQRIRARTDSQFQNRFVQDVRDYFDGCVMEAAHRANKSTPNLAEYNFIRLKTTSVHTCNDLHELEALPSLPSYVWQNPTLQRLRVMSNNIVAWFNDIVSADKESVYGDTTNLVTILLHEYQLTQQEALNLAADYVNQEVHSFLVLEQLLPKLEGELHDHLWRYVNGLKAVLRGNMDWSYHTDRYDLSVQVTLLDEATA